MTVPAGSTIAGGFPVPNPGAHVTIFDSAGNQVAQGDAWALAPSLKNTGATATF